MNTVDKAIELLNRGEMKEALLHVERVKASESAEDMLQLAEELLALGFMEQARELYEHLLALYPGEGELIVSLAEVLVEMDREDDAMLLLEKVAPDDEVYPSVLLLEADLYQMQGMEEVSEAKLLKAKQILPDEVIVDFALGELYFQQGKDHKALAFYERVAEQETEISGVVISQRIAEVLSSSGKFEEALPFYKKALDEKLEINTLFEYALTAYQAGMHETAIRKFGELKELDPGYHSLYLPLARSYEHMEELDKALEAANAGIASDSFNKELHLLAGKLSLKKGDPEGAEHYFREALALDPGYLEAALTLLKLLLQEEKYEAAVETIESIREYGEEDPQFDWMLAVSYQKLEQYKQALKCYQAAYNAFNSSQDFLEDYGFFLIEEGDRHTSREIFNKLQKLDPANDEYAMILERLGEDL